MQSFSYAKSSVCKNLVRDESLNSKERVRLGLVVGFKANCPLVGSGLLGELLSVGVFLRDPRPYLSKFRRKPRKTPNG